MEVPASISKTVETYKLYLFERCIMLIVKRNSLILSGFKITTRIVFKLNTCLRIYFIYFTRSEQFFFY